MKKVIFLLALSLLLHNSVVAQTAHIVSPSTVSSVDTSYDYNHFVYYNSTLTQKNKLFLFFPGTGGVPFNQRELLKHAANLGYHSIGLCYHNEKSINELCINEADITCHRRARLEVLDGTDRHDSIQVDTTNSILSRALNLLKYLDANYPAENWGQYYSGNQINWNKVMVSGHSQGGGHAGIISKLYQVDRVIMFAATDWIRPLGRYADWMYWTSPTPPSSHYGFIHQKDEGVPFNLQLATWGLYGMNAYGADVLTDTTSPPYNNSRMLSTLLTPATDTSKYHGCVVADNYLPRTAGVIDFLPVWTYLIDSPNPASLPEGENATQPVLFPNPTQGYFQIEGVNLSQANLQVYSINGSLVTQWKLNGSTVDVSGMKAGVYLVWVETSVQNLVYKVVKE